MDRNSIIGFSLLGVLVVVYLVYNNHSQDAYLKQQQKYTDSVANVKKHIQALADTNKVITAVSSANAAYDDSVKKSLPPAYNGTAQTITVENKKLALQFTTKGAYPISALVKGYKTYYGQPLYMFKGTGNELSATLPAGNGTQFTSSLYFTPTVKTQPNGDQTVDFSADMGSGKKVDIVYTLPADDYMMHCDIRIAGMPMSSLPINWDVVGLHTEKDISTERIGAKTKGSRALGAPQIYYDYKNGDIDYYTVRSDKTTTLDNGPVHWVGLRKQYFSTVLIDNNKSLSNVAVKANSDMADTSVVVATATSLNIPLTASNNETASFNWFIGPNDYRLLKSYNLGMEDMVPLGTGIFAFVKYINRYALIPIFYFLGNFISNYAVIIVIMTIFIRLLLSFFTYKSYLSAAKMRVMKPELDALRVQYPDQQKYSMEQMKLYRSVGINPLGGCLPSLFQMPFLIAMYCMFPSFIEFRQQHLFWAKDLSTYDSIAHLPFSIPVYGDHVSLFTLLMTASSLFLALYNRNNMSAAQGDSNAQMMKYMPFFMPVIFMGMFNQYAAALTFYYTFSNLLSIAQQFIIQKYFIDEKAIHAQLQANKNKPSAPSKWAQKLEQIQKTQTERAKIAPRNVKNK